MPQVQVISRTEDPIVKTLSDAGNEVSDSIMKAKTLQATRHYYDILGKNAETEAGKLDIENKKQYLDLMERVQKIQDPQVRDAVTTAGLKVLHGNNSSGMNTMASVGDDLASVMKTIKPDPGSASPEQVQGAQMADLQSQASLRNAQVGAINQAMGIKNGVVNGMPSGDAVQNGNGFMLGDMNIGGMNFLNTAAEQAKAKATALGSKQGEQQATLAGAQHAYSNYYTKLQDAMNEQGGSQDNPKDAFIAGVKGTLGQYTKKDSAVNQLNGALMPLAVRVTSVLNSGRGNLPEVKADMNMFPDRYQPKATNDFRNENVRSLLLLPEDAPVQVRRQVYDKAKAANDFYEQTHKNPDSPLSQTVKNISGSDNNSSNGWIQHKSGLQYKILP